MRYQKAAEIGRSDHQVHEALAEAWLRWEELDFLRGRNPEAKLQQALAAADRALYTAKKDGKNGYAVFDVTPLEAEPELRKSA